ncbi:PQQ-dependent sugar dehydrogenase [Massilia sp. ST3]|uniref:PQQ-dependent sugar dehydrogenase n=1 Tax=Massilia sp. ST3 TaxID=2824903 RepID=UPI001B82CAB8|nr:PQQ-dependent sugar dehydrogenase [Massilia sp. ST3]MBQ5948237.1 PQQ-dependent sugar dehydrogenase [Massilia sp. ST3]
MPSIKRLTIIALTAGAFAGAAAAQEVAPVDQPPAARGWKTETVAEDLPQPWSMAWLPDGRILVTGKEGTLHLVSGKARQAIPIEGLPQLFTGGQGGLLDISVHPADKANPRIYLTMASGSDSENRTVLVQGIFDGKRVHGLRTLFSVTPGKSGGQHFGSRLAWMKDGTLLMSIGDGGNPPQRVGSMLAREQAQNLGSHHGSILRLTAEGKPAPGNPLASKQGALPEIWSYGHRNVQGLAVDPVSGRVWASEHGPRGGDEINLVEGGKNYGWPLQSYGLDYKTREPVGMKVVPGMVQPLVVWVPSPAPSGLVVYTGKAFPQWQGSLFSGSLAGQDIRRVALDAQGKVLKQEKLDIGKRVRDVRQGLDGYLYALTDEAKGKLLRIVPQ